MEAKTYVNIACSVCFVKDTLIFSVYLQPDIDDYVDNESLPLKMELLPNVPYTGQ